jgi:hypothetical protein
MKLKEGKMKAKEIFKLFGGWIVALLLAVALAITIVTLTTRAENSTARFARYIEEERMRIEDTLARYERLNLHNVTNERMKEHFISYGKEIIRRHYLDNRIPESRQMTPFARDEFLEAIWDFASSGLYPNAGIPEGLFLPLAFARVESDFIPGAVGLDGERSVFQFMDQTARERYRRSGRSFIPNFCSVPREAVWLWFEYYSRELSVNFETDDFERRVRWTALAYNAGLYRNRLIHYFRQGSTVEAYLRDFPLRRGIATYSRLIWETYYTYRSGFAAIPMEFVNLHP